jgi:hypothetical protein
LYDPTPEYDADGGTVATFSFTAVAPLTGDGPWLTYLDVDYVEARTSAATTGGVKVFVNNAGYNAPSTLQRDITDGDDGEVRILGLANYTGFVDLQSRTNESGATITVYNQQAQLGSVAYASGTSSAGGGYGTAHILPEVLVVGTTYWIQVDAPLYLPTTQLAFSPGSPPVPTDWEDNAVLVNRPLTTLATVLLLGGDATDDQAVDVLDLTCIGSSYQATSACTGGPGANADVTGDGLIDILDLSLAGGNYYKVSSPWVP